MNTTRFKQIYLAFLITGFFLIPAVLGASDSISLTGHEKKLIEQGEMIVREIETIGKDGKTFEAIGLINATRGTIFQVLSEYEKYPEFMPNVSHVEIVGQIDNESIINYTLTLPLGKIKKYRLGIAVSEPESRSSLIKWQLHKWAELKTEETIRDTSGFWRIEEISRNSSLVLYHVYTDPGPIPFGLGWIVDVLSKNSVPEAFLQTKVRAERIALTNASE
jgi:ribosome-associated toxin RatA of RatAB toxin-antitoxin module